MRVFRVGEQKEDLRYSRGGAGSDVTQVVQRSDTLSMPDTDAPTHRRSLARACLLSMRAVDARARVEVARVRADVVAPRRKRSSARLGKCENASVPLTPRDQQVERLVTCFHEGRSGRLVNAESGTDGDSGRISNTYNGRALTP